MPTSVYTNRLPIADSSFSLRFFAFRRRLAMALRWNKGMFVGLLAPAYRTTGRSGKLHSLRAGVPADQLLVVLTSFERIIFFHCNLVLVDSY
jgi:hypothetical protein